MDWVGKNISEVKKKISLACERSGRNPDRVRIVAVTKLVPPEIVKMAYEEGQVVFGENRVQELAAKQPVLPEDIEWHLIGTLQRNKVKYVVGKVFLIHSVHSLKLAQEISKEAVKKDTTAQALLQVNISGEKSKHGFQREELLAEIEEIASLPGIKIKGLMTIAPLVNNPQEARPVFCGLRLLAQEIEALGYKGVEMKELSMGMSDDYTIAVEEGATLVRVGSRIFGPRNY